MPHAKNAKQQQIETKIAGFAGSLAYDPYGWVLAAFPWGEGELAGCDGPYPWQQEYLKGIESGLEKRGQAENPVVRRAAAVGPGVGAAALQAWMALWALTTYPDARGIMTSATERHLGLMWTELKKWYDLCLFTKVGFDLGQYALTSVRKGHDKTWRLDAVAIHPDEYFAFQGVFNKGRRIIVIYGLPSGIPKEVWTLNDTCVILPEAESIWCAIGRPSHPDSEFRSCFDGKRAKRWQTQRVDSRTCPGVNQDQIAEWAEDHGEDSDFFRTLVLGEFPQRKPE